ncbi:MAG: HEAT repeat domain-containing protein [Chloroflexota bacterium]
MDSAPAEPGQRNEQTLRLHHSQLAIAREYGFPSWPRLAAWVTREELPGALATQVELLGVRSWRVIAAATNALTAAGTAGVAAAIEGLSHPNPRVRRGAAGFMDHHADDSCVEKLIELALHDPVPYVRRVAVHAVQCQRCKPAPLTKDVVPMLVRVARDDPNTRVRTEAIYALGQQRPDARIVETLTAMLREETHPGLRKVVHGALKRQSPEYRQDAARRAREANLARRR